MWGDLCLSHIPRAGRTQSRDVPSSTWLGSIKYGGDSVSRQRARCSPLICQVPR